MIMKKKKRKAEEKRKEKERKREERKKREEKKKAEGGEESKSPKKSKHHKKEKKEKEGESKSPKSPRTEKKSEEGGKEVEKEAEKSPKSSSKSSSRKLKEEKEEETPIPASPKDRIVKQGWLEKKGVIRHNWTRRWMVLERKTEIRYYKNTFDSEPKGSIPLTNASVYSHVEKKGKEMPGYFNIRVGNRDFLLRAENGEEKAEWVKAIKSNVIVPKDDEPSSPSQDRKTPQLTKTPSFLGVVKQ